MALLSPVHRVFNNYLRGKVRMEVFTMPKGIQAKGLARENKLIHAGIKLFLENGYEKTTTASISQAAGMSPTSFFASFESKEALLLRLTGEMFSNQFGMTGQLVGEDDPVLLYATETALQIHITELSEPLRELYVMAYTLPSTLEYIYTNTAQKLMQIFAPYMLGTELKDFYELDIASGGITRGFMAQHCNLYFSIEQKLQRYLSCCMTIYHVPQAKQDEVIKKVLALDLHSAAERIIQETISRAEAGYRAALGLPAEE